MQTVLIGGVPKILCRVPLVRHPWHKIVNTVSTKPQKTFCDFYGFGSPHFQGGYLNEHIPQRWICRTGRDDKSLLKWLARSLGMTPCDFFL
ncbi:hypothetical protein TNCV_2248561 [Trichonephila clavipes]|nr:hypothetical protein TNCV_2248561 [Trichonephila clavipes]